MATEKQPGCTPTPSSHWFSDEVGNEPPHELLVSETRAVQEACATLDRNGTPDDICRILAEKGMSVDRATVERIFHQCRHKV